MDLHAVLSGLSSGLFGDGKGGNHIPGFHEPKTYDFEADLGAIHS